MPSERVSSITTVPGVASTSYKDDYKSEGNTDANSVKINGLWHMLIMQHFLIKVLLAEFTVLIIKFARNKK